MPDHDTNPGSPVSSSGDLPSGFPSDFPWHPGEIALQEQANVRELMEQRGPRWIRTHLIEQHREFFPLLPNLIVGTLDPSGDVWATIREGHPGFLSVPDDKTLCMRVGADTSDPAEPGLSQGEAIGLLGIQLGTRRRNRLNGVILQRDDNGFRIGVDESFGNCAKYIQLREFEFVRAPSLPGTRAPEMDTTVHARHRDFMAAADTFFVATYSDHNGKRRVDVSHRGGRVGFVRVDDDGALTIPDFAGNLFFNTLGNIHMNGRAGLLFPDFEKGSTLQLTGRAEVILDSPDIARFPGAERFWRFYPERTVYRADALALRWKKIEGREAPGTGQTGVWTDLEHRL
ncbi:MAG TPA: pyridoxamine 5'-phosphate oxidase family protein [Bradyrhizobium sp.]|nr:pyridoxamine 5'-phosphate oxidase family protein [Bradyrhizobium sp.]